MSSRPTTYEVLLLDFGGVCLLNPVELHHRTEQRLGLPPGTFSWLGPIDPSTDELWQQMIAGDGITERDYWAMRAEEVGRVAATPLSLTGYMQLMYEPPDDQIIRAEAVDTVVAAKKAGYGVSVLTNDMRAFHGDEWVARIDFLRLCDQVVDLSDTGHLKPDPRGYAAAIEAIGVDPQHILFVDDQPINVKGAAAAGIDAVWFDVADAVGSWTAVAARLGL